MPRARRNSYERYHTPFAETLRELIEMTKIPQTALAEHIGVTRQAVSSYVLGTSLPDIEKFEKIANYFDVSTEYLLGRTDIKKADASKQAAAEYLGLSEEAVDAIRGLRDIHLEQNAENDYKLTAKPAEPLPEVFSQWLASVDLPSLMSDVWRMVSGTVSAHDSGWNNDKYMLSQGQKDAIQDLKERGYTVLSMSQQVSFFSACASETFKKSLDRIIGETINAVNEQNHSKE